MLNIVQISQIYINKKLYDETEHVIETLGLIDFDGIDINNE